MLKVFHDTKTAFRSYPSSDITIHLTFQGMGLSLEFSYVLFSFPEILNYVTNPSWFSVMGLNLRAFIALFLFARILR